MLANRHTIARELLRQLLEEARREVEREQARGEQLRALIRAGKVAGLGSRELAEASGLSRQGVNEVLQRSPQNPAQDLDEIVLATVATGAAKTPASLAAALSVDEAEISSSLMRLQQDGNVGFGTAGYEGGPQTEIILLRPEGEQFLEDRLRRALHSRPQHWTAYLAVDPLEAAVLFAAAETRFGRHRTALLPETTTSEMQMPELALAFDVADLVGLFNEAAQAWHTLRSDASLEATPAELTAFSPPLQRSAALEAVGRGIAEAHPKIERRVMRIVGDAAPQDDEFTICVRALTEAAWALRRSVDQERRPVDLSDGERAFDELEAVTGLVLDAPRRDIQKALVRALERATDRLGPLPGGRLGSFRGPDEETPLTSSVTPTLLDLNEIAKASGEALGYAHAATAGEIDAIEAISIVSDTSDK